MSKLTTRSGKRAQQRKGGDKPKGLLHYLGMGVSAGLFGLVLLVGALVIVIPAVAGATPLTVLTSSMEPGLPPGTLVVVKPIDPNEIAMGDVITYQIESGKPGVITHRVTGVTNSSDGSRTFTLQGDNNDVADELQVLPIQVVGKLWYSVPWIGNVSNYVNGDGRSWLAPLVAVSLFVYAGFMISSGVLSSARKRKRARERAEREAKRDTQGEASIESATSVDAAEIADDRVRLG
ncbi:peptidase S26B, eukaryotic signal peptidase [marine actinobacterium PHSC20C1]|nr:peptidase S26B, eukaryotic signal peptidase [marine actinobacterium PHSC20C1]